MSEDRFRVLFEHSSDAHLIVMDGGIIDCNAATVSLLRAASKAEVLRLHPATLSPEFQPDGRRSDEKSREMDAKAIASGVHRFEWMHQKITGEPLPVEVTLNAVEIGGRPALIGVWHDLTETKRREREIAAEHLEVQRAHAALDAEFQTVGRIQKSLLPAELPRIPTLDLAADYVTSTRAGGDYYDLFRLGPDHWGFLIADVSGHGAPAAVVMAITHALAHVSPMASMSPAALLRYLNGPLSRFYAFDGGFVTAFYGVYDCVSRSLTYAAAGHPPPRLRRRSDDEVVALDAVRGLPLGVMDQGPEIEGVYREASVTVAPGDVLLMHTDGITEARRPGGELFGNQRLDAILRAWKAGSDPASLIAEVNGALARFTGGIPPSDDRTLLVALAI